MAAEESFETVGDYIASFPEATQKALRELQRCIREVAPEAEELFNYGIPAFALIAGGKREQQVMMAGYEEHVGFYPHPTAMEAFTDELEGYKTGKGSVQFPIRDGIPSDLVIRMVKFRKDLIEKSLS